MMYPAPAGVKGTARPTYTQGNPRPANPPKPSPVGFQFTAIPSQLLRDGSLSFGAIVLLGVIADASRQSRSGLCKLCNRTLAARFGRSESEVGRYLLELEGAGLVVREYAGGSKFVRLGIRVTWEESEAPGVQGAPSEQVRDDRRPVPAPSPSRVPGVSGPIQNAPQTERKSEGSALASGEETRPDPAAAGAYLRACVAAARRGEPMPEPPAGVTATKGYNPVITPPPAPTPSPDATRRVIEGFAQSLGQPLALKDLRRPSRRR